MKKNTASQAVGAQLVSATDGSAVTSGTTTVYVTGDAGTQAAGSVGSGACTHEGNGYWTYAPAQAETNYDLVAFTFVNTAAVNATVQIYTSFPQTGDNYARLGAPAGASVSADVAAVKADTAATLIDTAEIGAAGAGLTGITGVTLAASQPGVTIPTVTTLTGHTPQTGDSFARIGAAGAGLTALGDTRIANLDATVSSRLASASYTAPDNANIALIVADTNELQIDWANGGRLDLILDARASQSSVDVVDGIVDNILIDTAEIGAAGAGLTVLASAANLATVAGYIDTEIADIQSRLPAALVGGRIDASVGAMAANTLTASALATDAVTEIQSGLATASALSTVDSNVVLILADTNELQTDWVDGGRLDNLLDGAASAGDPWTTALPGAYGAGTAGYIVGNNLNAAVGSLATQASVDVIDGIVDNILIDTAEIGAAGAGLTGITGVTLAASQPGVTIPTVTTLTGHTPQTGDNFVRLGAPTGASVSADVAAVKSDTAAVKTKTDFLPSATAGAAGGVFIAGTNAATTITTGLTTTFTGDLTGSVGSVTGAVGSVTGNVGGNVTGSVGSIATGGIAATSFAANAVNAAALATDAVTEIQSGLATASALSTVDSNVVLIVADTSELQTDWTNGGRLDNILDARAATGDAMTLTSGERTTLAGVIWSTVILGTRTAIQLMRGFAAALLAKASGMNTGTAVFRDVDDTKDVITATVDQYGNRSSVTLDLN